jgi:hypothetical protein|tara:strand:- start:51 stop:1100 length:1050 start_codon:yes stop_codon:yes gene_type:complete
MNEIIPEIRIEGREVPFTRGAYTSTGGLTAATLEFTIPRTFGGFKKLWNKEVTFYPNSYDNKPLFRGYIKRIKEDFNSVTLIAQDVIGYMVLGGDSEKAKVSLTDRENVDGLTIGNAIRKTIKLANLDIKIKTDYIGDTTPLVSSSQPPIRGTMGVLEIIKKLMGRAVDDSTSVPRSNILKVFDDGTNSQLAIELEADLDTTQIKHVFTEFDNINNLRIVNKKTPTIVIVTGDNVVGKFEHESAIDALDRTYLEVTNDNLKSPAECRDFAQKIFRANLETQYEYSISSAEGIYLMENDVIRVETEDPRFSGNYRVRGKKIAFGSNSFTVGLNINKKPPTLVEFIAQQDN